MIPRIVNVHCGIGGRRKPSIAQALHNILLIGILVVQENVSYLHCSGFAQIENIKTLDTASLRACREAVEWYDAHFDGVGLAAT